MNREDEQWPLAQVQPAQQGSLRLVADLALKQPASQYWTQLHSQRCSGGWAVAARQPSSDCNRETHHQTRRKVPGPTLPTPADLSL